MKINSVQKPDCKTLTKFMTIGNVDSTMMGLIVLVMFSGSTGVTFDGGILCPVVSGAILESSLSASVAALAWKSKEKIHQQKLNFDFKESFILEIIFLFSEQNCANL